MRTMHRFRCAITGLDLEVTHVGLLDELERYALCAVVDVSPRYVTVLDLATHRRYRQASQLTRRIGHLLGDHATARLAEHLDAIAAYSESLADERAELLGEMWEVAS